MTPTRCKNVRRPLPRGVPASGRRSRRASVVALGLLCGCITWGLWHGAGSKEPRRLAATARTSEAVSERGGTSRSTAAVRAASSPEPRSSSQRQLSSVRGVVRTSTGKALAGAQVCLVETAPTDDRPPPCTVTGRSGQFELKGQQYGGGGVLLASAAGYLSARTAVPQTPGKESTAITIALEAGGEEIAGLVVDATGGPVIGAIVAAGALPVGGVQGIPARSPPPEDAPRRPLLSVTASDAEGRFRLSVPAKRQVLVSARAEFYSAALAPVVAPARDLTLVLVPASEIVGRVLSSADSLGLGDVLVTAFSVSGPGREPRSATTNAKGEFRLTELPAGAYEVSAFSKAWRSTGTEWVSVGVGEKSEPVLLQADPAVMLSGLIRVDGEACASGSVVLVGPTSVATRIDDDGRVEIQGLLSGSYRLTIECVHAAPWREALQVQNAALERTWDLESGLSLSGRVEEPSGEAVAAANVQVHPLRGSVGVRACPTNAFGEFTCSGLLPGPHRCVLSNARGQQVDALEVVIGPGGTPPVVLHTAPAATIYATISDGDADPAMLTVFARRAGDVPITGSWSSSQSRFVFDALPLGRYSLTVGMAPDESTSPEAEVSLDRVGQTVKVSLSAPALAPIEGSVVDSQGTPVVDAWVRAALSPRHYPLQARSLPATLTDQDGNFTLSHVPPGQYEITASSPLGEVKLNGVPAGAQGIQLKVAEYAAMSGVVVRPSGEAVTSFELRYESDEESSADRIDSADGAWSLPWLPPGSYRVTVASSEAESSVQVSLAAGSRQELVLTLDEQPGTGRGR